MDKRIARAIRTRTTSVALLLVLVIWTMGCRGLRPGSVSTADVSAQRAERKEALVGQYEEKRDGALIAAAADRIEQGDRQGGRQALERLLARSPENREARLLLSDVYLLEGEHTAAAEEIRRVLKKNSDDATALHAMGVALEFAGNSQEARSWYAKALAQEPKNQVFQASLEEPAAPPRKTPDAAPPEEGIPAEVASVAACAGNPEAAECLMLSAAALRNGVIPVAIGELQSAMNAEPDNSQIPAKLAHYAMRLGHTEAAAIVLQAAVVTFPESVELHRLLGLAWYRLERFDAARNALEGALSLDNSDALTYFLLGHSLQRLGQPEAAAKHLRQARRIDPSLAQTR